MSNLSIGGAKNANLPCPNLGKKILWHVEDVAPAPSLKRET